MKLEINNGEITILNGLGQKIDFKLPGGQLLSKALTDHLGPLIHARHQPNAIYQITSLQKVKALYHPSFGAFINQHSELNLVLEIPALSDAESETENDSPQSSSPQPLSIPLSELCTDHNAAYITFLNRMALYDVTHEIYSDVPIPTFPVDTYSVVSFQDDLSGRLLTPHHRSAKICTLRGETTGCGMELTFSESSTYGVSAFQVFSDYVMPASESSPPSSYGGSSSSSSSSSSSASTAQSAEEITAISAPATHPLIVSGDSFDHHLPSISDSLAGPSPNLNAPSSGIGHHDINLSCLGGVTLIGGIITAGIALFLGFMHNDGGSSPL